MFGKILRLFAVVSALLMFAALTACASPSPSPSPEPSATPTLVFSRPTSEPTRPIPPPPTRKPSFPIPTPATTRSPVGNPSYPGSVLVPDAINLVHNGNFGAGFERDWKFTTEREHGKGDAGEVAPGYEGSSSEGAINFINIARRDSNHAEVDLTQQIDQVVPAGGWMQARVVFRIWNHDVPRCGEFGTECPVMLRIRWQSSDGEEQEWIQGFYAFEARRITEPTMCKGCGMPRPFIQVPPDTWYAYESPNLLFDMHDKSSKNLPYQVESITLAASGHSFEVQFAQVSLLVRKTSPSRVSQPPPTPRYYQLRQVTVHDLLINPARPGEDIDLEAYFSQVPRSAGAFYSAGSDWGPRNGYDYNVCYWVAGASLTGQVYSPLLPDLLWARTAPGSSIRTIPFHARLRGHFDRALSYCPFEERTFAVVDVVENYCQGNCPPQVQMPLPGPPAPDISSWKRYEDAQNGYHFSYPDNWRIGKGENGSVDVISMPSGFPRITIRRLKLDIQRGMFDPVLRTISPRAEIYSQEPLPPGPGWANRGGVVMRWQNEWGEMGLIAVLASTEYQYVLTCAYPIHTNVEPLMELLPGLVSSFSAPDLAP